MRPPLVCADSFLAVLRASGLLDERSLARLTTGWGHSEPAEDCAARLVNAGLLTPFQAEHLLAGRPRRLRIGPYRLLARLGAGAGGVVYKAEHVLLRRLVALKIMGKRGRDEAQLVARLSHPNIVSAYDVRRYRGRLVLAMEYADGIDLERLVREGGPLPVPLALEIARQAALALSHLHHLGLAHRDVKPANLVLISGGDGGPVLVKLLDLGLARALGQSDDSLCGTPNYLAPERGDGDPLDIRSDLYSLGCTLFLLLTGQLPFTGDTVANRILSSKLDDPTPLRALRPDAPEAAEDLINQLLAREKDHRPADPDAVLALLAQVQRAAVVPTPPVKARAVSAAPPRKPRKDRRWLLLAASILLGIITGGAARGVLESTAPGRGPEPATPPAARSFVSIEGRSEEFATLRIALAAVPAGGVVVLHGDGPFLADGLACDVTLRAAEGCKPRLRAGTSGWEPMLSGNLTLIGLDLWGGDGPAPLVESRGRLRLVGCSLRGAREGPLVSLRKGASLQLKDCRIDAARQAASIEAPDSGACAVAIEKCAVQVRDPVGTAVLAWRGESGPSARVEMSIKSSSVQAGRIVALRRASVNVNVQKTRLAHKQALASIDGAGRAALRWRAEGAALEELAQLVRVNGRMQSLSSLGGDGR